MAIPFPGLYAQQGDAFQNKQQLLRAYLHACRSRTYPGQFIRPSFEPFAIQGKPVSLPVKQLDAVTPLVEKNKNIPA